MNQKVQLWKEDDTPFPQMSCWLLAFLSLWAW